MEEEKARKCLAGAKIFAKCNVTGGDKIQGKRARKKKMSRQITTNLIYNRN